MIERLNKTQTTPSEPAEADDAPVSLSALLALKRDKLEKLAVQKGVDKPHLMKNKDDIALAVMEADGITPEGELTPRQEQFCQLYAGDREFFGNGVQSYIEAYDINLASPGAYASAQAAASRLLSNVMVLNRIDEILQDHHINDQTVDKTIGFWIRQKANPMASVAAIKEYNRVRERVKSGDTNVLILQQQNNQIHFGDPRAQEVISWFDGLLMEQTKAPQEGAANGNPTQPQPSN